MRMKLLPGILVVAIAVVVAGFAPQEKPEARGERQFSFQQDSARFARMHAEVEQKLAEVRKSIEGREDKPATEVFKNLKIFKEAKAGQIPGIMGAWSNALGTSCQHCHVVDQWAKDDKPEKQIARDMSSMLHQINSTLAGIKNLDSKHPRISCWTCHHSSIKPPPPPWARRFQRKKD